MRRGNGVRKHAKKVKHLVDIFENNDNNLVMMCLGDFIPIEEKPPVSKNKGRLMREDGDDDVSDEERVDMSAINGSREREERREKFYSVQAECRTFFLYKSH